MSEREEIGTEAEPRMRRRLLGYRRADVEEVLEARDSTLNALEDELDERDAELEQLRQDIAALWLAFAQHDRMITDLTEVVAATGAAARVATELAAAATGGQPVPVPQASPADEGAVEPPTVVEPPPAEAEPDPPVGRQLAELDEVLAAIEMATQTLEQTYADEVREAGSPPQAPAQPAAEAEAEAGTDPGDDADAGADADADADAEDPDPDGDEDQDDAEAPEPRPSGED